MQLFKMRIGIASRIRTHIWLFGLALPSTGRRGGSVVYASDLGPEGREFEPWPVHPRCVVRQNT